jgi:hypothetical protein
MLAGVLPWTLWDCIDELDAVFRADLIPDAVARRVQGLLRVARRRARRMYLAGLIALPPVVGLAVALVLAGEGRIPELQRPNRGLLRGGS